MGGGTVLWTSDELGSAEHCSLEVGGAGATLAGTTVLPFEGRPARIRFSVTTDPQWRTRSVDVEIVGHRSIAVVMRVDDGAWSVDGVARPDLAGCADADLGWTPATNTLPIRRLGLDVGESAELTAAWLRFPDLVVVPSRQRYVREGAHAWRYLSGDHDFALETNAHGLVTRYGDDLWVATATADT